ncbi:hypothetical protein [Janthinobacterium sp. NKUCC06_STL]|jgi:hypothetical protein|uniref:hypothetical protein n=1 Tax=Janthinobacterium sp. NKUCC06_STL TaxID=2842127 RepID=UPI001C5AB18B|nr:hypothetical protein [Janthinobacterium sp. NKUCC06_STL]MBW3512050.1 hypothetical protein [Janthinobacterium sp. NKUCC06_STL]
MDHTQPQNIVDALTELSRTNEGKSNTARLREILPAVEATLKSGVTREKVLLTLNAQGFDLTMMGFKSALQRLRKEKRSK